jgi:hypothetical protein
MTWPTPLSAPVIDQYGSQFMKIAGMAVRHESMAGKISMIGFFATGVSSL